MILSNWKIAIYWNKILAKTINLIVLVDLIASFPLNFKHIKLDSIAMILF